MEVEQVDNGRGSVCVRVCVVQIQANERLSRFFLFKETVAAGVDGVERRSVPSCVRGCYTCVCVCRHNKWVTCIKGV